MRIGRRLFRAFGIRSGEGDRVGWLVAQSMFIGVFCAFFLTAANALFLDTFEITMLPVAYIVAAAVGYLAVMGFSRLEKRVPVARLLVINLIALTALGVLFWFLARTTGSEWVIFAMFVWVGPAFSLIFLGYWGLAVRLFDLRQGKRLFGLVGAGEEVSTVIGLFSIPLLMRWLHGPVALLLISVAGLVGCLAVVLVMVRLFRAQLVDEGEQAAGERAPARSGLGDLVKHRYFLLMAALIILLSLAHYIVDFSFLSQVRSRFTGPEQIAQFLGLFFGVTKILELLMKVFVSGRLLSQFGLKVGLLVLPALLTMCAGFAILIGTVGLAVAHFFVLVALAKLVWVVARTSTFLPSFRVLYQPVARRERLAYQTHVDGTAKQLAIGVVGVALLLFSSSQAFNALNLFYVLVPILVLWFAVVVKLYADYRVRLMANLEAEKSRASSAGPVDRLMDTLMGLLPEQLEESVAVLARIDSTAVVPLVERMLRDGDERTRVAACQYVERLKAMRGLDPVRACATGDPSAAVREAAQRTVHTLEEVLALSRDPERVRRLASSELPAQRDLAVSAIGYSDDPAAHPSLTELLWDKDRDVRRASLVAAGRTGNPAYWHRLCSQLFAPQFANAATFGLICAGEPALGEMEKAFSKAEQHPDVQARIIRIYERIDHPRAREVLLAKLSYPNRTVRRKALQALSNCGFKVSEEQQPLVVNEIEDVVRNTVWNMSAVLDLGGGPEVAELRQALEYEIASDRETLFLLLSLLFDPQALELVRRNLESQRPEAIVYALEIMDLLVNPELKPLLFPLLEDAVYQQALKRLDAIAPRYRMPLMDRLSDVINRDYDRVGLWTRAAAVELMGRVASEPRPELVASLYHPDAMVREAAGRAILRVEPDAYARHLAKLRPEIRDGLAFAVGDGGRDESWETRSAFGRAVLLKRVGAFAGLPTQALASLAQVSEERVLREGQRLPAARDTRDIVYVFASGDAAAVNGTGSQRRLGEATLLAFGRGLKAVEALAPSRFVRLDPNQLFELAAERVELVPALLSVVSEQAEEAVGEREAPIQETLIQARDIGMSV